jgi:hypothetical protein
MGGRCGGPWVQWQVEHGLLQNSWWDKWKGEIVGAKVWEFPKHNVRQKCKIACARCTIG